MNCDFMSYCLQCWTHRVDTDLLLPFVPRLRAPSNIKLSLPTSHKVLPDVILTRYLEHLLTYKLSRMYDNLKYTMRLAPDKFFELHRLKVGSCKTLIQTISQVLHANIDNKAILLRTFRVYYRSRSSNNLTNIDNWAVGCSLLGYWCSPNFSATTAWAAQRYTWW